MSYKHLSAIHLNEIVEIDVVVLQQIKNKLTQAVDSIKTGINDEIVKTSEAYKLIKNSVISGVDLTPEEKKQVGDQLKSILVKLGYASLLLIPGATTTMIFLKILKKRRDIKKMNSIHETTKPIIKRLLRENLSGLAKRKRYITENVVTGKTIINVDIQPEYENAINFNISDWVNFINQSANSNRIIFLYNGEETMGMVSEIDFKMWLMDLGIEEDVIDSSRFYDKGYAFFRYCMDSGIDENNVADLVRFMSNHNISDSREINDEMWNQYMEETNHDQADVRELLENADDMISIPDLMEFLNNFNNIVLTGGGINECLKEVEIALLALNKPFNTLSQFTY